MSAIPSYCICGHRRGWHTNSRTYCQNCTCQEFIKAEADAKRSCKICKASWTADVTECPVCTDPAVLEAIQVLTGHGIDGRKYGQLLKLQEAGQ